MIVGHPPPSSLSPLISFPLPAAIVIGAMPPSSLGLNWIPSTTRILLVGDSSCSAAGGGQAGGGGAK